MIRSEMIASRSEVVAGQGVVAAGHMREAEAGIEMLRAGGNAIDAVVAAAFAGFVVEPASCGIGGYGRLAIRLADGRFVAVDHYLRAPAVARPDMFAVDPSRTDKYYGFPHTMGLQAEMGPMAPGVPGAVAGLCAAQAMFGRLRLARVMEPAIGLAEDGVPVDWTLQLTIAARIADIRRHPDAAAFLLRDGAPPAASGPLGAGERLDTRALAGMLKAIADHGAAGLYEGKTAAAIARACAVLTADDLRAYRPRILIERPSRYRGHDVVTTWDQVGTEALNILACFDLASMGRDSVAFRHVMAEALACAFADNMTHYGDPDFEQSPVEGLASPAFAAARAAGIVADRVLPRPVAAADPWPFQDDAVRPQRLPIPSTARIEGTSQMVAADRAGNVATLITSLSSSFGSLVYVPEAGVMLNNGMQNFDPRPGTMNCIRPGKMPIFAAPALIAAADGGGVFGASGSGGYRIETGVLHAFVHAADFGLSVQAAIDAPRVHCQGTDTFVDARIAPSVRDALAGMGHRVVVQRDLPGVNCFGRVAAVAIAADGTMRAGSGPAWATAAAGY
jgi:gamma-glutamyltranspeptidase/glutathione hydrolase